MARVFRFARSGEGVWVRAVLLGLAFLGLFLGGCVPQSVGPSSGVFAVIVAEPREGQAPLTVQFDATRSTDPAGPIADYLWDFGDGSPVASGAQISHTFRRAGEYLVTLVVVGPSGTGRATTLIRALNNPPKASFTAWPKDPFTDESVTFDASASSDPDGDPLRFRWDFGDGSSAEGKIVQHTYKKAGEYVVILTVSDPAGAEDRATTLLKVEECAGGHCGRR
jgi:PKD repeat protein